MAIKEHNPGRHWKFECPYLKHNDKIRIDNSFSWLHQIDISDKKPFEIYESGAIKKAGKTDQSEVVKDDNEGRADWQRVSTDKSP